MKIAVKNLNNSNHTICRISGERITISPKGFIIFDVEDEREISYWEKMSNSDTQKYGLDVIVETSKINELESGVFNSSSVVDNFVSPIAKEIASSTAKPKSDTGNDSNSNQDFTEENLLKLAKEDLFNICDNFNIKYKKSNSVKTLVKLLIENGVVEK